MNGMRWNIRLGHPAEERATPQPVEIDVKIFFSEMPVDDFFYCYGEIGQHIEKFLLNKEHTLVEILTKELYKCLQEWINNHSLSQRSCSTRLWVRTTKIRPPVRFSLHNVQFCYTDLTEKETYVHDV
jgi:dihydroneopterin aldolase